MKKYGFRGVFFVMTVSLGKLPHYMTASQVKELFAAGNVIGSHTWDHHNVRKYQGNDWVIQLDKPTKQLEAITGAPIHYFAYPFGLWNRQAFPELRKRGFITAFQLADKMDPTDPLMTIRRIIVGGGWSLKTFDAAIKRDFH
jgi:peptidoglycan/xylan/chitin deacetylase (PgdA/CDA1 family)